MTVTRASISTFTAVTRLIAYSARAGRSGGVLRRPARPRDRCRGGRYRGSPGRLEVMAQRPVVVLDGAKNVAGAEASAAAVSEEFGAGPHA